MDPIKKYSRLPAGVKILGVGFPTGYRTTKKGERWVK